MQLEKTFSNYQFFTNPDFVAPEYSGPRTILIKAGLTFPDWFYQFYKGASHFEERLWYYLAYVQQPNTRLIYMLSEPIHPEVAHYFSESVAKSVGRNASELLQRVDFFVLDDDSDLAFDAKLRNNTEKMSELKTLITDPSTTYMDPFSVSDDTVAITEELGIPWFGNKPETFIADQKSEGRRLFRQYGIVVPNGVEDCYSFDEVFTAWKTLGSPVVSFLLKNNTADGGLGTIRINIDEELRAVDDLLQGPAQFTEKMTEQFTIDLMKQYGAALEQFVEAEEKISPSIQYMIWPNGSVECISTHDQIVNENGEYRGAIFPAAEIYRHRMQELTTPLIEALAAQGVRERVAVDFLATRDGADQEWELNGLELNIRKSGTTHPMEWTRLLTGAIYDSTSGLLKMDDGTEVYYCASEYGYVRNDISSSVERFLDAAADAGLLFDNDTKEGIQFHLLTNLSIGKVGFTAIGHTPERATEFYNAFFETLGDSSHK